MKIFKKLLISFRTKSQSNTVWTENQSCTSLLLAAWIFYGYAHYIAFKQTRPIGFFVLSMKQPPCGMNPYSTSRYSQADGPIIPRFHDDEVRVTCYSCAFLFVRVHWNYAQVARTSDETISPFNYSFWTVFMFVQSPTMNETETWVTVTLWLGKSTLHSHYCPMNNLMVKVSKYFE